MLFLTALALEGGLGMSLAWLLRVLAYSARILDWMHFGYLVVFLGALFVALIIARFVGRQWMPHVIASGLGWEPNYMTGDNYIPDNPRVPRPPRWERRYRKQQRLGERLDYYVQRMPRIEDQ